MPSTIDQSYQLAKQRYADLGIDTDKVMKKLAGVSVSMQCWQGDDVMGFEPNASALSGGIAVTGNHPGRARTPDELRADFAKALSLIPGRHRINLHAFYGEYNGKAIDRDAISIDQFKGWVAWAKAQKIGIDFNPTCFAHPKAASGFTLSSPDKGIRQFWIEHCQRSREIAGEIGKALGKTVVTNHWVPDGYKDVPADRLAPRERLRDSLDAIFARKIDPKFNLDAVEPKLFGLGTESYTVGSHEFYLGYAISRQKLVCLDSGHFHPTEVISDKISSVLQYVPELLLHVSRGVRWDSDHVITLSDEIQAIAQELVWNGFLERTHIGLDYFDASINRVAAWVIGTRNMSKALLMAMLAPIAQIRKAEAAGDYTSRLALLEEARSLPWAAVWDRYCEQQGVPVGESWLAEVKAYEKTVLAARCAKTAAAAR